MNPFVSLVRIVALSAALLYFLFAVAFAHATGNTPPPPPTQEQNQSQGQKQGQIQIQGQGQLQGQSQESTNVNTNTAVGGAGGAGGAGGSANANANNAGNLQSVETPRDFLPLPGFVPLPSVQPYLPSGFAREPAAPLPVSMTMETAEKCRARMISDRFDGEGRSATKRIDLTYANLSGMPAPPVETYVGTVMTTSDEDYSFRATLCEAAYHAMQKGVTRGYVRWTFKPVSTQKGVGFGTSGGGSVIPNAGANTSNPYALAGVLGFGTGYAKAEVQGVLMIVLEGYGQ